MSVQSAAVGFKTWSLNNKIIFNIPLIGNIALGIDTYTLLQNFVNNVQRKLELRSNKSDLIFSDETGEVLAVTFSGRYVSGIKYIGIARQIPQNIIYISNGKSYISNICIDNHMIWIKDLNEVKIKKVTNVPSIAYNSKELSVEVEPYNKKYATELNKIWSKFNSVSSQKMAINPNLVIQRNTIVIAKQSESLNDLLTLKDKLECKYDSIRNKCTLLYDKIYKLDSKIKYADESYNIKLKEYNNKINLLNGTYTPPWGCKYTLQNLFDMGKLKYGKYGEFTLNDGTKVNTFYTEEDAFWLENVSYRPELDKNSEIVREIRFDNPAFNTEYVVAHNYKKKIAHEDEAYKAAKEWVCSLDYKKRIYDVKSAYLSLKDVKDVLDELKAKQEKWQKSPEYVAMCVEYKKLKDECESLGNQIKQLNDKIYNKK